MHTSWQETWTLLACIYCTICMRPALILSKAHRVLDNTVCLDHIFFLRLALRVEIKVVDTEKAKMSLAVGE